MGVTADQGDGGEHWVGDRYRLVAGLGRGGMGSVWQAFDERLHRTVAVKMLDPSRSPVDQGRAEALALAQLNHPHIANIFDYGEDDTLVPPDQSAQLLDRYCAIGVTAERLTYPGADHVSVIGAAIGDLISYATARVAGEPAPSSCP